MKLTKNENINIYSGKAGGAPLPGRESGLLLSLQAGFQCGYPASPV
jgi:hypothetical protein